MEKCPIRAEKCICLKNSYKTKTRYSMREKKERIHLIAEFDLIA